MQGGSEVVNIKPEAKLLIKSIRSLLPVIYPPITPKAFANVP